MRLLCSSVALVSLASLLACGGGKDGVGKALLPDGVRSQAIEHEACEESGHRVELVDVNDDGKPDIRRVFDGTQEVCRISDLNRDGRSDFFEYFDKTGQLRRREADFDDNGVVNSIEIYENGKLARAELDTMNQGRIDTWDTFDPATGARIKRERDSSGRGRVDQWWTWSGDQLTIDVDKDGDGRPDPQAQIMLGANGAPLPVVPPGASDEDAGAPAAPVASAPTPAAADPSPAVSDAGAPVGPHRGAAKR